MDDRPSQRGQRPYNNRGMLTLVKTEMMKSQNERKQAERYYSPVITAEREKVEAKLSALEPL